ncbi:uncharacterized protein OCT59_030154 [Rhizophagus irregularis]|uniref:uncharacterized protein n=1 Tax=Rhizophagus irregularis TaxID=588596 RepID=UPI003333F98A|nr:hypothetical protein OCT59_030154 [Rhizophagus irregularis]
MGFFGFLGSAVKVLRLFSVLWSLVKVLDFSGLRSKVLRLFSVLQLRFFDSFLVQSRFFSLSSAVEGSSALMGPLALSVLQLGSFGSSLQLLSSPFVSFIPFHSPYFFHSPSFFFPFSFTYSLLFIVATHFFYNSYQKI